MLDPLLRSVKPEALQLDSVEKMMPGLAALQPTSCVKNQVFVAHFQILDIEGSNRKTQSQTVPVVCGFFAIKRLQPAAIKSLTRQFHQLHLGCIKA